MDRFLRRTFLPAEMIWRMVRKVIFNAHDRKRLMKEAREYMALRAKRKKFIADQRERHRPVTANAGD